MARLLLAVLLCCFARSRAQHPASDAVRFIDLESENSLTRNTDTNYRLDKRVEPIQYDINITPYFDTGDDMRFTFTGLTNIILQAKDNAVNQITLHALDLTILSITLNSPAENNIVLPHSIDPTYALLRIPLSTTLNANQNYTLTISYRGLIQGDHLMRGFYRSWFKDDLGNTRWMGTTQFQPGHARRAFPCFDEPSFKAVFVITINRPVGFSSSISNMPIAFNDTYTIAATGERRVFETFYPTPRMSTYLIAFIVSEYVAHNSTVEQNELEPFAVYGRRNALPQGQYAFDVGIKILNAMDNYTAISYYAMAEHIKMEQAAIPDFSAGAMENWGLLTYREALSLYDPLQTSDFYKQRIANIISHEVAHMWFGDLVTCDWWNNLWLNEGFARYYQYFLTNEVETYMQFDIKFVVEQVRTALFTDSTANPHALTYDSTNSPAEVTAMFGNISYNKGAAIIRMIEHLLGHSTFVKGLQEYLRNNAFSTTVPSDLYTALDNAAREDGVMERYGVSVATVMSTWVAQNGYPLITVSYNRMSGRITVQQQRFFQSSSTSPSNSLYSVPLTFTTQDARDWDNTTVDYILNVRRTTLDSRSNEQGWIIFNKKGTGFYRVNYDAANWESIFTTLNSSITIDQIDPLNRALIIDDLFQLSRADIIPYYTLLRYVSFLQHETSYPVWINALQGFTFLQRRLAHVPEALELLQTLLLDLLTKVIDELGYEDRPDDSHLTKLLRIQILNTACDLGHEDCTRNALRLFAGFNTITNPSDVPPNLRSWVYCTALRNGGAADYDFLWRRYQASNVYNEKIDIIAILGCTSNEEKLHEYLNQMFEEDTVSGIRAQDVSTALSSAISGNLNNTDIVFDWLKTNYSSVRQNYYDLNGVVTVVNSLAGYMIYEKQIIALEDWVSSTPELGPIRNSVFAAALSARQNLAWANERIPAILTALKGESSASGLTVSALIIAFSLILTLYNQNQ